ncbi:MAG: hypothetical protein ACW964_18165 [Candidatus Hodarchaeales archaeon]|jgi:hypothetical protein
MQTRRNVAKLDLYNWIRPILAVYLSGIIDTPLFIVLVFGLGEEITIITFPFVLICLVLVTLLIFLNVFLSELRFVIFRTISITVMLIISVIIIVFYI